MSEHGDSLLGAACKYVEAKLGLVGIVIWVAAHFIRRFW